MKLIAPALVAALVAALVSVALRPAAAPGTAPAAKESAYDRVMRTGTIRCGYIVWSPMFMKDPNTGSFSGIFYDYVEAAAKALELKVDWVEEVTPATYVEALKFGRFDMLCSADWPDSHRGRYLDYVDPIFYLPLTLFVRADDTRFDNHKNAVNDPSIRISTIDGEMSSIVAAKTFPQAKIVALPQMSDATQMLENVANGKADVAITALTTGLEYMRHNPGKLREAPLPRPIRLFPNTLSMRHGEDALRQMMNTATHELLYDGTINSLLDKYEEFPGSLYRIGKPYESAP